MVNLCGASSLLLMILLPSIWGLLKSHHINDLISHAKTICPYHDQLPEFSIDLPVGATSPAQLPATTYDHMPQSNQCTAMIGMKLTNHEGNRKQISWRKCSNFSFSSSPHSTLPFMVCPDIKRAIPPRRPICTESNQCKCAI